MKKTNYNKIINDFVSNVKSETKDAHIIERHACDWCKESMLVVPAEPSSAKTSSPTVPGDLYDIALSKWETEFAASIEHLDCDDFVFCQRDCAVQFYQEKSEMQDAAAEARED